MWFDLEARRGFRVSAETVRRWRRALGWSWKRAKLAAQDNDPERVSKRASIRLLWETLPPRQVLLFADELDIALRPKTGYQGMPPGTQVEVMTPGKNEKRYLAGAWEVRTGPGPSPRVGEQNERTLSRFAGFPRGGLPGAAR